MNYVWGIGSAAIILTFAFGANVLLPRAFDTTYDNARENEEAASSTEAVKPKERESGAVVHVPLPSAVKAIYMTSCAAGTPSFRAALDALLRETELNSIVIDIKDYSGTISFPPSSAALKPAWDEARCGARDMAALIKQFHDAGVYVIGRITVFQDPFYTARHPELAVKRASDGTVWKDHKGLSFIDVGARPYWDYIIELSTEAYNLGFDELNFDYVRYPSDGDMQDIVFTHSGGMTKPENLETFFRYLHTALVDPERYSGVRHTNTGRDEQVPYLSVDLFGMTTSSLNDLQIGQIQERAAPYFDFIAPMVYPSHYPKGFIGLADPNDHPYKVIHYAMSEGASRMRSTSSPLDGFTHTRMGTSTPAVYKKPAYEITKLRPWLQDFDYGGDYDAADIRAQIQATYDVGLTSWMMWDPSNRYTRAAYLPLE